MQELARQAKVLSLVKEVRLRQPRIGGRKLQHIIAPKLAESGRQIGRDALFDLLRWARMLVVPRRAYHKTTDSHHRFRRHPNLLKVGEDQVMAKGSEQVWVADVTYLPTCGIWSLVITHSGIRDHSAV